MCDYELFDDGDHLAASALPLDRGHEHGHEHGHETGLPATLIQHPLSRRRLLQAAVVTAASSAVAPYVDWFGPAAAQAATGWPFFRTDPHVHCVVSGDAVADPGILAAAATAAGKNPYDVIFMTDHHLGSKFLIGKQSPISGTWDGTLNGGTEDITDSTSKWSAAKYGTLTTYTSAKSTTHVKTISPALKLKAQAPSGSYGEAMGWYKRGPNLLSTSPTITFAVYPTLVDPGCSVFISASIGGDPTTPHKADGYTQKFDHSPLVGRSHVLVWQLGASAVSLNYPSTSVVHQFQLGAFQLNAWNTYTINVADYLSAVTGGQDAPVNLNAMAHLRMAVSSRGGIVEAYFDDWKHTATALDTPQEFSLRNQEINTINGKNAGSVQLMPSIENGLLQHAMRFNLADASAWKDYKYGTGVSGSPNSITDVQATGYPAMLNHPGLPGGPTQQATIDTDAYGADIMEACPRGSDNVMVTIWDAILAKGTPLIGSWTSDAHRAASLGPCTYIQAPTASFNDLMQSFFEGRAFMANRTFPGKIAYNLVDGDSDSYPARYPVYVPAAATKASVHLNVSSGIASGSTLRWVVDNATGQSSTVNGPGFNGSFAATLASTGKTYVRAELLTSAGARTALTQAIMFYDVTDLPLGYQFHVSRVSKAATAIFSKTMTKGITTAGWNKTTNTLTLSLGNVTGSLVEIDMTAPSSDVPQSFSVDGSTVTKAASQSAYASSTTSAWFNSGSKISLKVLHGGATATAMLAFTGGAGDSVPPSVPGSVNAQQSTAGPVVVTWAASTDNVAVDGYTVYRDGAVLDTVGAGSLTYSDTTTTANTTYGYTVDAFDAAGLHSAQSSPSSLTTRAGDVTTTFADIADTYASSASPTTTFGTSTSIKVDGDGVFHSYLRFAIQPTGGQVISATLRIFPTTSHTVGYDVYGVSDDTWSESTLTWNTKPPMAGTRAGSSGRVTASTWTTVDVTSLVSDALLNGGGHANLGLQTTSTTALSMSSRETTNAPQLVVVSTPASGDTTAPAKPGGVSAAQGSSGAVTVSWNGNTEPDLAGYTVFRDGATLGTVAAGTLSYSDTSTAPSTTYSYAVDAFDTAGNHSSVSDPASLTTRGSATGQTLTLAPTADSYVQSSSPTTNYGTATTIRVDGDGIAASYLRFAVPATAGSVTSAKLRVYANTAQTTGYDVYDVADDAWTETGLNWNNKPAMAATKTGSSGRVTASTWTEVDVSALLTTARVNAGGNVNLGLATASTTALSLSSRQGPNPPQLVIVTT